MDPMTSLLANVAFGLAFIAFVFVLYVIGRHHTSLPRPLPTHTSTATEDVHAWREQDERKPHSVRIVCVKTSHTRAESAQAWEDI
jgi:hypothetical protein